MLRYRSIGTWILGVVVASSLHLSASVQKPWTPNYDRRDEWQQPDKVLEAVRISRGMVIADVGAGDGYFAFKLAERVGAEGKVYATDIAEEPLGILREKITQNGTKNLATILGTEEDLLRPR